MENYQRSAKLIYKYEAINKLPSKLKLEINTTEHFQVLPLRRENLMLNLIGLAALQILLHMKLTS